jgi:hypothetical protein
MPLITQCFFSLYWAKVESDVHIFNLFYRLNNPHNHIVRRVSRNYCLLTSSVLVR